MFKVEMKSVFLVALFALCLAQNEGLSNESPHPLQRAPVESIQSMAVFGDSIAAGMLADTVEGEALNADKQGRLVEALQLQSQPDLSATELRDEVQRLGAAPNFAAFTGAKEWSHLSRLERILNHKVTHFNFALNGADTESLSEQIINARSVYKNQHRQPADYVVLEIGANDFCGNVSIEKFRGNFQFRLYQILQTHPQSTVLVTHIPDVVAVMTAPDAPAFLAGPRKVMCSEFRTTAQTCKNSWLSPNSSALRREEAEAKLALMNEIIEQEVAVQRDGKGSFKPYAGKIAVAPLPKLRGQLNSSWVAADCFHPSELGQQNLAEQSWTAVESFFK